MKLIETKAKYNYGDANVELTIELDDGDLAYVHLAEADGTKHFTLSKTSIFAYMTDSTISPDEFQAPDFEEDFDSVEAASGSKVKKYYELAQVFFDALGE